MGGGDEPGAFRRLGPAGAGAGDLAAAAAADFGATGARALLPGPAAAGRAAKSPLAVVAARADRPPTGRSGLGFEPTRPARGALNGRARPPGGLRLADDRRPRRQRAGDSPTSAGPRGFSQSGAAVGGRMDVTTLNAGLADVGVGGRRAGPAGAVRPSRAGDSRPDPRGAAD